MKILLDECITKKLKNYLKDFQVFTINELGWTGKKNGELIKLCTENGFEIFLSLDKNLAYQQNLKTQPLAVIIFNASSSKLEELVKFLPSFKNEIKAFKKGEVHLVDYP